MHYIITSFASFFSLLRHLFLLLKSNDVKYISSKGAPADDVFYITT
jgi:hypothetical protein